MLSEVGEPQIVNRRSRLVGFSSLLIISLAFPISLVGLPPIAAWAATAMSATHRQDSTASAAESDKHAVIPIHRQLTTGLHLIVVERPGSAVTAIEVQVRFGSGMETAESNGLAHLTEHMVFKGNTSMAPGAIDRAMEDVGGELNARTGRNSTQFSTLVPSPNWQKALDITGDMLHNAVFRLEDIEAERQVIHGEMAWADCDAVRSGYSDLARAAFGANGADRFSIMGPADSLDRFTVADLTAFYQRWYQPENITLAVVGDVKADEVAAEAAKLFPTSNNRAAPTPTTPGIEPQPLAAIVRAEPRSVSQLVDRGLSTVFIGFPVPMSDARTRLPEIETLISLLAVPEQSQGSLKTELIDRKSIALSITAEFVPGAVSGMLVIAATGEPRDAARIEEAVVAEIRRLRDTPASEDVVSDARSSAMSNVQFDNVGTAELAHRLANQDVEGISHDVSDAYADRIGKVTPDSVNALISQYLTPSRYAVAVIGPPPPSTPTKPRSVEGTSAR